MRPAFSFITPTYNCAAYILRCYWSLCRQTVTDWEWVVVDDGSTDDTESILRKLKDSRIQLFRRHANLGRGPARDFALQEARGDWFAMMDMDDLSYPDRLEFAMRARDAGRDFLCSYLTLVDSTLHCTGVRGWVKSGYPRRFPHATLCGKGDLIRRVGYPSFRRGQDQTMVLTVANNFDGEFAEDALYIYQEDRSSSVRSAIAGQYALAIQIWRLRANGTLHSTGPVWRMFIASVLKVAGLLPLLPFPAVYRRTLRRRASLLVRNCWEHSPERRNFLSSLQSCPWVNEV